METQESKFEVFMERTTIFGMQQRIYRFGNRYGASVIIGKYSFGGPEGKFELAVIQFASSAPDADFSIRYDTPITADVIGYLSEQEVQELLTKISALPEKK